MNDYNWNDNVLMKSLMTRLIEDMKMGKDTGLILSQIDLIQRMYTECNLDKPTSKVIGCLNCGKLSPDDEFCSVKCLEKYAKKHLKHLIKIKINEKLDKKCR